MGNRLKKNVPVLRFSEFVDDWKILTIEEIASISSGGTPSRTESTYWNGDIPWITTSETSQSEIFDSLEKITQKGLENSSAKIFSKNTILMAMYGQGKTRGQVSLLRIDAATSQNFAAITLKKGYSPEFVYCFLYQQYEHLRSLSNGNSHQNLSSGLVKSYKVPITSLAEQEKIASFLGAVDTRLTQLRRKHELLQTYKRGVMQKLFSQQIRFKDDDGQPFPDWKEKRLGDIADTNKSHSFTGGPFGSDLKSSDYTLEGIRVIQLQNIGDGYFLNDYQIFTSEAKANQLISCNIYPNDILLSKMGDPVARACIVPNHHERYLMCSDGIRLVVNNKLFNTYFIYSFLNAPAFRKSAESASSGSTRKRIGLTNLRGLKLACPVLQEQEKIANFLMAIDQKIEAVAKQIDLTEQFKKGLLQKMFV